jgi:hypothetical protein
MTIPTYLSYFIAAGTVAVLITIFYGLNRALADARWPRAPTTSSPWAKGTYVGSCNPTRVTIMNPIVL